MRPDSACANDAQTVKVWDIEAGGAEVAQLAQVHKGLLTNMAWNLEGSLLATACKDKTLRIFGTVQCVRLRLCGRKLTGLVAPLTFLQMLARASARQRCQTTRARRALTSRGPAVSTRSSPPDSAVVATGASASALHCDGRVC